jgi:hypothetical protein
MRDNDDRENVIRKHVVTVEKRCPKRSAGFSRLRGRCRLCNALILNDSSLVNVLYPLFAHRRHFHRAAWATGAAATPHAPSEGLESLRNLGRFPDRVKDVRGPPKARLECLRPFQLRAQFWVLYARFESPAVHKWDVSLLPSTSYPIELNITLRRLTLRITPHCSFSGPLPRTAN